MNIEQFNPTVAELNKMVVMAKTITKDMGLEVVKDNKTILQKTRTAITEKGKELREEALAFQRGVISKEKELLEILAPEEERLKGIIEEFKAEDLKKERLTILPERKEKLLAIDGSIWATDEQLLEMDGMAFGIFYNNCVAQVYEKAQAKLREEQAKLDEEKNKLAREQELKDAEEKGRLQAIENEKNRLAREEQAKKQEEDRIAKEKVDNEKKLADSVKYQAFLKKCGVDGTNNFEIKDNGKEVMVYKLVDTYTK